MLLRSVKLQMYPFTLASYWLQLHEKSAVGPLLPADTVSVVPSLSPSASVLAAG